MKNEERMDRRRKNENVPKTKQKFTNRMQKKLVVLFCIFMIAFIGLALRLMWIGKEKGEQYSKQVLSQQRYDSVTLPFRRGDIVDCNGTRLAVSEKVYNLVIDANVMLSREEYLEPTMSALASCFPQLNISQIRTYITEHPSSRYYVPLKKLSYNDISAFKALQEQTEQDEEGKPGVGNYIKGVWFEEEYKRTYPNGSLACDVIGFTTSDGTGLYGLEEYYNDILNGTTGREFGYLNTDSNLERTTKPATDGYTLVTSIDVNIQSSVERYLQEYDETYRNNVREGAGANNIACIVMEVNTGNVLAMASYPYFDLNNPYDLSAYYSEEEINALKQENTDEYYNILNGIWRNFCITDTYEPGSTFKPFTVAMGLETGKISPNDTYECNGSLVVVEGQNPIHCHNVYGDGTMTLESAIATSCNVALMKMALRIGSGTFAEYQHNFNFGLKTNIDLAGEARTAELVHGSESMGVTELATGSFGQGFNVTMIQMITGFCALINGGYYYEPHLVKQITTTSGAVVENIEPRILRQVISESTSDLILQYCNCTCDPDYPKATGKKARPAGYSIGGKTGTAQTLPRGNGEYVVSFMGYAPADNPQIAVYVVIDRPNLADQTSGTAQACYIARNILTEVLPYRGIFMTEDLSQEEIRELQDKKLEDTRRYTTVVSGGEEEEKEEGTGERPAYFNEPAWVNFPIDPATGYRVDPNTGEYLDPETGDSINGILPAIEE